MSTLFLITLLGVVTLSLVTLLHLSRKKKDHLEPGHTDYNASAAEAAILALKTGNLVTGNRQSDGTFKLQVHDD